MIAIQCGRLILGVVAGFKCTDKPRAAMALAAGCTNPRHELGYE